MDRECIHLVYQRAKSEGGPASPQTAAAGYQPALPPH